MFECLANSLESFIRSRYIRKARIGQGNGSRKGQHHPYIKANLCNVVLVNGPLPLISATQPPLKDRFMPKQGYIQSPCDNVCCCCISMSVTPSPSRKRGTTRALNSYRSRERRAFAETGIRISEGRTTVQRANDTQATTLAKAGNMVIIGRRSVRTDPNRSRARAAANPSGRIANGGRVERTD